MPNRKIMRRSSALVPILLLLITQAQLSYAQTTAREEAQANTIRLAEEPKLSTAEEKLLLDTQTATVDLRFQDAAKNARTLLLSQAEHIETNRLLGIALANIQSTEASLKQLDRALSFNENDAETHYALGVMHLRRAQEVSLLRIRRSIRQSKDHLEKTLALNPEHISARFYLIQILINTPELAGGDDQLASVLQEPFALSSPIHFKIIDSEFAIIEKNYALAETLLLDAHKNAAVLPVTKAKLAEFYLLIEEYSQAINFANQFLAFKGKWDDSSKANIYQVLAKSHVGLGEIERGINNYNLAIENTNNKKLIRQLEKEIQTLSGQQVPIIDDQKNEELSDDEPEEEV